MTDTLDDLLKPDNPGCEHYVTRCKLICPTCDNHYYCRFCHDLTENAFDLPPNKQHIIDRHAITEVLCTNCNTRQPASNECQTCKIQFASYFCNICNLYDDNGTKQIYHCDKCNICRVSNGQSYYHCDGCNTCIAVALKDQHKCADVTNEVCPICDDMLFTTRNSIFKLNCGHWIHTKCFQDMLTHGNITCPFCSKLMVDLTEHYNIIDEYVTTTPMPNEYVKTVSILCNECVKVNEVNYHFYGLKCPDCGTYNTKQISDSR